LAKAAAGGRGPGRPTYYQNYILREDEHPPAGLLSFQAPYGTGKQSHPDELLFVAVHQTYELWFKVAIDEIMRPRTGITDRIKAGHYREAARALRRLAKIVRVLRDQYEVVGTISPSDFLLFRDVLRPSSGYDSAQFRALELASGLRSDGAYLRHLTGVNADAEGGPEGAGQAVAALLAAAEGGRTGAGPYSVAKKLVSTGDVNGLRLIHRALTSDSMRDAAYHAVLSNHVEFEGLGTKAKYRWSRARSDEWKADQEAAAKAGLPHEVGVSPENAGHIQLHLSGLYRRATAGGWGHSREGALLELVEALLDYDQAFRDLRTTHVHMVLRVIGGRPGTGGSTGARYLRTTLDYEFFPLFWRARDHIEGP
jgi:tryptophan 2,3-dioxygenase